eukprot:gi/632979677/ref/XP_007906603.1/ PREDICTED: uncharacterized protein LOC103188417 [Callorhinchus milii]
MPQVFQVYATAKNYGETNYNGTFYLHSDGEDLLVVEFDAVNENRSNARVIGVKAGVQQSFLSAPERSQFQLTGKASDSGCSLVSSLTLDERGLQVDLMGSKEDTERFHVLFSGSAKHNLNEGRIIPQFLHVAGNLKQKDDVNEGELSVEVDNALYRIHLQNNNTFSARVAHHLVVTLAQNGSLRMPAVTEFEGHLELGKELREGRACWRADAKSMCFQLLQVTKGNQIKASGKVAHNLDELITTGLPADGTFTLNYDHTSSKRAVTVEMESGGRQLEASVRTERTFTETPVYQLNASLQHSVEELRELGLPLSASGSYRYQNLRNGFVGGVSVGLGGQGLRAEIEQKSTARAAEIFLSFNQDLEALSRWIPTAMQVNCSGETSSRHLLGHCSGAVDGKHSESLAPARFFVNGSMRTDRCEADLVARVRMDRAFAQLQLQTACSPKLGLDLGFGHSLAWLRAAGVPADSRILVRVAKAPKREASVELTLGKCGLKALGEVRAKEGARTDWSASLTNRCPALQRAGVPQDLETRGSVHIHSCSVGLKASLQSDGKTAELQLETTCEPKYTVQALLRHTLPQLSDRGLPRESRLVLSAVRGATLEGSVLLQSGKCRVRARGDLATGTKTKWMWATETDCQVLQVRTD